MLKYYLRRVKAELEQWMRRSSCAFNSSPAEDVRRFRFLRSLPEA
jgi:hypothetical protein